jgi:hypothetical protein
VALAREWQDMLMSGGYASAAELPRALDMSRARITQVPSLLRLHPEVLQQIAALGDPLQAPIVTERKLRDVSKLSAAEQKHWVATFFER